MKFVIYSHQTFELSPLYPCLIICFRSLGARFSLLMCPLFSFCFELVTKFSLLHVINWYQHILWIADLNHSWRLPGFGSQAMSTSTLGTFSSSNSIGNVQNKPDHLLVLVHGIMARYFLWLNIMIASYRIKYWEKQFQRNHISHVLWQCMCIHLAEFLCFWGKE